jgi:replicative DNA helicase
VNYPESVLYAHLTEAKSLDVLIKEGFSAQEARVIIPTELGREIVKWCLDTYFAAGRQVAPSKEAIEEVWEKRMMAVDISIEDDVETDSVEWAIEDLRSRHAERETQRFIHELGSAVTEALPPERVGVIKSYAGKLYNLAHALTSHRQEATADRGLEDALSRYRERAASGAILDGLTFGLPEIDNHIMGIRPGELAVLAAYSGVGKSWVTTKVAFAEWKRGRRNALITLENDLEMSFDRMACSQARIPYDAWQRGEVHEADIMRVEILIEKIRDTEHAPIVIQPGRGDRTALALVRRAFSLGADSVSIDQLSFVERGEGSFARERNQIFAENITDIANLIKEGNEKIPALVINQINRKGAAEARKTGRYEMDALAESSKIEQDASFVFTILQREGDKESEEAIWQTLKARRVKPKDWLMSWRLDVGDIRVREELTDV